MRSATSSSDRPRLGDRDHPRARRDLPNVSTLIGWRIRQALQWLAGGPDTEAFVAEECAGPELVRLVETAELRLRVSEWRVDPDAHKIVVLRILRRGRVSPARP
jgi:hypothetical protein